LNRNDGLRLKQLSFRSQPADSVKNPVSLSPGVNPIKLKPSNLPDSRSLKSKMRQTQRR
ncbi:hypothetical protein HC766_08460, partial [Candidatus Gracilibacteria bacterium]|nr:hypothetical protein [Candidatus Gracilibacteria bacterium]